MKTNIIYNEECLQGMAKHINNKSIDMILADLPYNTTSCKWDSIIPFKPLWEQYKRVIKDNGAIVLTASQPFTTKLINSNMEWFRYEWIWNKVAATGFLMADKIPLKQHENICVFYKKQPTYNPQKYKGKQWHRGGRNKKSKGVYGELKLNPSSDKDCLKYPKSILKFSNANKNNRVHPTQKVVALFKYLVKTYTNKNEIVLDNVIGSGTTAVACLETDRKFIGFENNKEYYHMALERIGKYDKSYYEELPGKKQPKEKGLF